MSKSVFEHIKSGTLANADVLSGSQPEQAADLVEQFLKEGVETVRLVFADQHGILRGKTVVTEALASAFANGIGMPSTLLLKDTAHKTVFPVWNEDVSFGETVLNGASDVLAAPDPNTATKVPWSPHSRMILCRVLDRDYKPVAFSSEHVLHRAVSELDALGYQAVMGLETEFQIFETVDASLEHGQATMPPDAIETRNVTQGWQYLSETRYGEAEDILDVLRRAAQNMGLEPRTIEIEMGPSQFEFTFAPSDPMTQANRYVLFRTMVKEVCHLRGLHASFMAKPKLPNAAANGWHIHQSLYSKSSGDNAFMPREAGTLTSEAAGWIAGLLDNAAASCLMTTPTINGYKRYAPFQLAPNRVAWGEDNRGAMVRALLKPGDTASRIENRVADSAVNPYFALAAQILSGTDGLRRSARPPEATTTPYAESAERLPQSLIAAVEALEKSAMYKAALGETFVNYLLQIKRAEWERYLMTVSEWEQDEYFNLF